MGASTLYQSTDTSAPTLLDTTYYLVNLLTKVLVDGYGTKSGLGWTREYVSADGNIAVFRNAGTGLFLQVDNLTNYASTGIAAKITVYEAMGSYAVGYLRTPEDGVTHYLTYANTKTGARACAWKVIGDDKGFWLCSEYSTTAGLWTCAYFGDYTPYHLENQSNWISMTAVAVEVNTVHLKQYASAVNTAIRISRTYQNARPSQQVYLAAGTGVNSTVSNVQLGSHATLTSPVPVFSKPLLLSNTSPSVIIGEIPGLYEPINLIASGSVIQMSSSAALHVFQLNENNGHIALLVGEGFRNDQ